LDGGVAAGGAEGGCGFELVRLGGWLCGDVKSLLACHVAGLDEAQIVIEL
ncbi:MAG: hypothetical protein RLZZ239_1358, partial [Pseudomonadota bacterium]